MKPLQSTLQWEARFDLFLCKDVLMPINSSGMGAGHTDLGNTSSEEAQGDQELRAAGQCDVSQRTLPAVGYRILADSVVSQ